MTLAETAQRAARAGGAELLARLGGPLEVTLKDARVDVTSSADLAAQRAVAAVIRAEFPTHRVIGEERDEDTAAAAPNAPTWYVDPLDGTRNYLNGVRFFCVSVAATRGGVVQAGAVYDPSTDEMFTATRGGGATCNGAPLRVAATTDLAASLVVTQAQSADPAVIAEFTELMGRLMNATGGVRFPGAPALVMAHVAAGRYTAYVERRMDPWDIAAGRLLIAEAGGRISDFGGAPAAVDAVVDLVASNAGVHDALVDILKGVRR
jgi:myo-inositol-1(or 4)-monophosphatase